MNTITFTDTPRLYSGVVFSADNERGLVLTHQAIERLRSEFYRDKLMAYLVPAVPNKGRLYGMDSFNNYHTNNHDNIAAKITGLHVTEESGVITKVTCEFQLTGLMRRVAEQMIYADEAFIIPRTVLTSGQGDDTPRFIQRISGLYFASTKQMEEKNGTEVLAA